MKREETYPFIDDSLNQALGGSDSSTLANDGDVDRVTSLWTRTILALGRHLDISNAAGLLNLLDLGTFWTDDLAGGAAEDLHRLLTLLLRVIVAILVVTCDHLWLRLGDVRTILLIALVGGGSEGIDNVLEEISVLIKLVICFLQLCEKVGRNQQVSDLPSISEPSSSS
jgi:hypothetical protein